MKCSSHQQRRRQSYPSQLLPSCIYYSQGCGSGWIAPGSGSDLREITGPNFAPIDIHPSDFFDIKVNIIDGRKSSIRGILNLHVNTGSSQILKPGSVFSSDHNIRILPNPDPRPWIILYRHEGKYSNSIQFAAYVTARTARLTWVTYNYRIKKV